MDKTRLGRANRQTKKERLERLLELRGEGKMRFQCITILCEEWNMSETGVQKYWDTCNKLLKEGFTDEDLISGYMKIHSNTLTSQPAIALKAYDSIAKLKKGGFNGTEIVFKIEHKDEDEGNKDNQSA